MELTILEATPELVRAGYACPCGCRPSVDYGRGTDVVDDACCCGNHFAVGPRAAASLSSRPEFHAESQTFNSPWGERLEAAWLIGPSVHGPWEAGGEHEHTDGHGHGHEQGHFEHGTAQAVDPICGMTVEPDSARATGLHSSYQGTDYFFCGKGCKLEFDEDPAHYLDPSYVPSM